MKTRAEMFADGLRETGILVGVFGVLYALYDNHEELNWILTGKMLGWAIMGVCLFFVGVEVEENRQ